MICAAQEVDQSCMSMSKEIVEVEIELKSCKESCIYVLLKLIPLCLCYLPKYCISLALLPDQH